MTLQFENSRSAVKDRIETGNLGADRDFSKFVEEYAATKQLGHSALVLELNYKLATEESDRALIRERMLELVTKVSQEQEQKDQADTANELRQRTERINEHFSNQAIHKDIVFTCNGLGKKFRSSNFSLEGIDLELRAGEICGVVGENANGKTTLFRIIAGELLLDQGSMTYPSLNSATRLNWTRIKQQIAYVKQELPRWYGSLENNLRYEAAIHGVLGEDNEREVQYMIERLNLRDHLSKRWNQLSGGYKLRFSLARALVWKPKLLLMDEPLANLDFKAQLTVLRDVRNLASSLKFPISVVISSQHLHEVEEVADKVLFLKNGRTVYYGPTGQIGQGRRHNTYEVGCNLEQLDLANVLGETALSVHYSGLSFIVTTPLPVDSKTLLNTLLSRQVDVRYFRDISGSIKQLFSKE